MSEENQNQPTSAYAHSLSIERIQAIVQMKALGYQRFDAVYVKTLQFHSNLNCLPLSAEVFRIYAQLRRRAGEQRIARSSCQQISAAAQVITSLNLWRGQP